MSAFARAAIIGIVAVMSVVSSVVLEAQSIESAAGNSPSSPEGSVQQPSAQTVLIRGDSWRNPKDGAEYRFIPAGEFLMGCVPGDKKCAKDEKPRHTVRIERGFWMMETEVEVAQYRRFVGSNERSMPKTPSFAQEDGHPVVNVTWLDAKTYCEWAGGRLATETEWEYAARGGNDAFVFPWGSEITHDNANYVGAKGKDRWRGTSPVGSFDANGFGLFDMAGNVGEWIEDVPLPYRNTESSEPGQLVLDSVRGFRGGSWTYPWPILRTSCRMSANPYQQNDAKGIRCVRDIG